MVFFIYDYDFLILNYLINKLIFVNTFEEMATSLEFVFCSVYQDPSGVMIFSNCWP